MFSTLSHVYSYHGLLANQVVCYHYIYVDNYTFSVCVFDFAVDSCFFVLTSQEACRRRGVVDTRGRRLPTRRARESCSGE